MDQGEEMPVEQRTSRGGALGLGGGVLAVLSLLGLVLIGVFLESTPGGSEGTLLLLCWAGLVAGIVLAAVAVVRSTR
ncbi:hypothetical protein DQ237_14925 [Blastococcus sp. TF02-8]|uniref:hypothetical protein n=1 Tax=Blastococcus sp. TF02-8 TaxID=2250574 RepID=UPI000DEB3A9F|nr:hypothetical protein [Blastococcus sp. TF02-8]RBY95353.1 hypothetical protein DQ237_14925 [Blastococcus sp. TF02-8]